jgi:hypothetical protein
MVTLVFHTTHIPCEFLLLRIYSMWILFWALYSWLVEGQTIPCAVVPLVPGQHSSVSTGPDTCVTFSRCSIRGDRIEDSWSVLRNLLYLLTCCIPPILLCSTALLYPCDRLDQWNWSVESMVSSQHWPSFEHSELHWNFQKAVHKVSECQHERENYIH